jgi:hypothetical protein
MANAEEAPTEPVPIMMAFLRSFILFPPNSLFLCALKKAVKSSQYLFVSTTVIHKAFE